MLIVILEIFVAFLLALVGIRILMPLLFTIVSQITDFVRNKFK